MCLGIPGQVKRITGDSAIIDFGGGTERKTNIALVTVKEGDYVIVHAGFAIEVLDREAAEETLDLWKEYLDHSTSTKS
ncbi:MAG: HypC/HybG/HupF family hydrogenase formation chaperone [Candidatus Ranarchaeia archaeon]